MINRTFRITPRNSLWCDLHWQVADSSVVSWIIINGGEKVFGPLFMDTQQRSIGIPFAVDDVLAIEIHDLPIEQIAEPIHVLPNTRPILRWNPVEAAVRYRIYHQSGQAAETRIYDGLANITETRCPIELTGSHGDGEYGGVWHFLRVEAVDQFGNESTRQSWRFYACDLPSPPTMLTVTDGDSPGTFTFEIGV